MHICIYVYICIYSEGRRSKYLFYTVDLRLRLWDFELFRFGKRIPEVFWKKVLLPILWNGIVLYKRELDFLRLYRQEAPNSVRVCV